MKIQARQTTALTRRGFLGALTLGAVALAVGANTARAAAQSFSEKATASGIKAWRVVRVNGEGLPGPIHMSKIVAYFE